MRCSFCLEMVKHPLKTLFLGDSCFGLKEIYFIGASAFEKSFFYRLRDFFWTLLWRALSRYFQLHNARLFRGKIAL